MSELDTKPRRERKFGPIGGGPDIEKNLPSHVAERGGGSANWKVAFDAAMGTSSGSARDALLKAAKKKAETFLDESDDAVEMTRVAAKIAEIEGLMGSPSSGGIAPISQSPGGGVLNPGLSRSEAGSGNREVVRIEGELAMKLRGHIIAAIINGNVDENALNSGVAKFVADNVLKRADLIVINENDRKLIEEEIKARVELQKSSNYWIGLKGEPVPLKKMKETVTQAVALSPESERWLERPNHNCSYIDEVTGERVEIRDLASDINLAARELLAKMGKPKADPGSVNLQTMFASRDYVAEAKKLTGKTNIGVIALQLAEAGIWAAEIEIPDEGFRHPAADIVKYARTRFLAASKGKPALNGHRLIQEYQEKNRGGMPADESVFVPEGESLGRTELGLFGGARAAIEAGQYLTKKKEKRRNDGFSYSEEVRDDLVAACQFLTSLNDLTGAESAMDPTSLVGKFFVIKINLGKVATRFLPTIYSGGVDTNEASRKTWASGVMTETVKTGIWANSLLNKWNSKSVLNMPELYEVGRLTISSQTDSGEPLYVGSLLPVEEAKRVNIEFVNWFGKLWDKYEPIITNKEGNSLSRMVTPLGAFFLRNDIPKGVNANNGGIFVKSRWTSLLNRGLVAFARRAATRNKLMGLEK